MTQLSLGHIDSAVPAPVNQMVESLSGVGPTPLLCGC